MTLRARLKSLAADHGWWKLLNDKGQTVYLKAHPHSRMKRQHRVRFDAPSQEPPSILRLRLIPQQERRQIREKLARKECEEQGYPVDKLVFVYDRVDKFKIGDAEHEALGLAHVDFGDKVLMLRDTAPPAVASPPAGTIELFPDAMSDNENAIQGVVAHEVMHQKEAAVRRAYNEEYDRLLDDEDNLSEHWPDGSPVLDVKKYPIMVRLRHFILDPGDVLMKADGCTDYSAAYWRADQIGMWRRLAVSETLAEIAYLVRCGAAFQVAPVWMDYYNTINELYDLVTKKGPQE